QSPINAQQFQLVVKRQSVTAFAFDGRDSEAENVAEESARANQQVFLAGRAREPHGLRNSAALSRDVGISGALAALAEFIRPPARKSEMRMAIDQSRDDEGAATVVVGRVAQLGQFRIRTGKDNPAVIPYQGRICDRPATVAGFEDANIGQ